MKPTTRNFILHVFLPVVVYIAFPVTTIILAMKSHDHQDTINKWTKIIATIQLLRGIKVIQVSFRFLYNVIFIFLSSDTIRRSSLLWKWIHVNLSNVMSEILDLEHYIE